MEKEKLENLEKRINSLSENVRSRLVESFLNPLIRPKDFLTRRNYKYDKDRYTKDNLVNKRLREKLDEYEINYDDVGGKTKFFDSLYSSIRKEPLKRVYYGTFNINLPKELVKEFDPYMLIYFYAGAWTRKSTRLEFKKVRKNVLENQALYKIVYDTIIEGMRTIKKIHNQEYREGKYKYYIKSVPHEEEILKKMKKPIQKQKEVQPGLF